MDFKVDDKVILNDESQKYYRKDDKQLFAIFIISKVEEDSIFYYGYKMDDQLKNRILIPGFDYRIATESEVKTYKLKNLFNKRSSENGI